MKNHCPSLIVLVLFGLFSFSEGKPCPERTKAHKSRCDIYYKCTEVSADKHVWVPVNCEEGLVYEHSLMACVLPADDWECLMGNYKLSTNLIDNNEKRRATATSNSDDDIYIVSNADEETNTYDEGKVEIIIGPNISDEDKDDEDEENLYDGSGNGGELVQLDGFMPAQNRQEGEENDDVHAVTHNQDIDNNTQLTKEEQKVEQKEGLEEILHTIKTQAEIGQPSTNIDPKLTAHLQRLSQLIDGLKQTYQTPQAMAQDEHTLRPDQLNAFLAHFNIKNKFDSLDPSDSFATKSNRTLHYKQELNKNLNPETKVVLSHALPQHYEGSNYDNGKNGGGYSNSQIVVNRPGGSVHFSLPEHYYTEHSEYSSENTPKISEETLKTVLELSKQMIAQQNVPKLIPSPAYFASPIMQPILLTPHTNSPFSTNYVSTNSNNPGLYNAAVYSQNYKPKKPLKRPPISALNNDYYDFDSDNDEAGNASNGYNSKKPATTIIHNNVIPVHVSHTNSEEKDVVDSYGQNLGLYPPLHEDRLDSYTGHHGNANNDYGSSTSTIYNTTPRPFEVQSTASAINQYFTPSEHLSNQNVNSVFSSVDNYGSIPQPMKDKKPNVQNYKPLQETTHNHDGYGFQNQLFPQMNTQKVYMKPNSQNFESLENQNGDVNNYQHDNDDEDSPLITYTYGNNKKKGQHEQFSNYANSDSQPGLNTVFSNNNLYMPRPQSHKYNSVSPSNSYYMPSINKYTALSSPATSTYGEGMQLVNVGGNFISLDVFQNSILPLVGNNPAALSSSLNNVEVITCAAGVRQPNTTDCTRYYVCSKKDGRVLSYSCPPYTAFNRDARICDAKTFAMCNPDLIVQTYSVFENKRIQMEALKALQEAKRRQQQQLQAIKAENVANLLQQYNNPTSSSSISNAFTSSSTHDNSEPNMLDSYMQQAAPMSFHSATTAKPQLTTSTVKKRKYYCKEGDKIADQTSIYNYFVCYKNAKGQMKGHKMTCSKGLLFCPTTTMCTLSSKCS